MHRTASTSLTIAEILSVATPSELRTLGHFNVLKTSLSALLGLTITPRSWQTLYRFVGDLQAVIQNDPSIRSPGPHPVSEATRTKLSTVLMSVTSARISAADPDAALSHAVATLVDAARDPAAMYQATRTRNFHHSSRLEGIDMRKAKPAQSLQTVLDRYRKR